MLKATPAAAALLVLSSVAVADARQRGLGALGFVESKMRLDRGLYAEHVTPGERVRGNASAWSAGVMLSALNAAAALDAKRIPAAHAYAVALDAYRFTMPGHPVGYQPYPGNVPDEMFYDDNAWLVLAFLDTHALTKDPSHLQRARDAFEHVASGESDALGGGLYWSTKRLSKNTCTNAPAICGALALHEATKEPRYLALAERWHAWVARLQDEDGLYFDNVKLDGTVEKTKWSYNSALMIRANVMLHRVTRDATRLAEAERIATAAEARWFRAADGALTDEGSFAHLLCEALLELDAAKPRPAAVARVNRALDFLATLDRGGGYPKRWDGRREGERRVELLQQASAARAFLVAADHARHATTRPAE